MDRSIYLSLSSWSQVTDDRKADQITAGYEKHSIGLHYYMLKQKIVTVENVALLLNLMMMILLDLFYYIWNDVLFDDKLIDKMSS